MNEKFNKNAKVEQLTKMFSSREEEKGLIVKDPYGNQQSMHWYAVLIELLYTTGQYLYIM